MMKARMLGGVLVVAAMAMALPGCSGMDWETRQCQDLVSGSGASSNGKTYQHGIDCTADGVCETVLKDDMGNVFFDCTDGEGRDCLSDVVDAEFSYCGVG
jgi:hypothetical protein